MAELTANQLFQSAVEKGLTNVTFTVWIENKNKEYADYVKKGGSKVMTFSEWETANQNPIAVVSKGVLALVAVIAIVGVLAFINRKVK